MCSSDLIFHAMQYCISQSPHSRVLCHMLCSIEYLRCDYVISAVGSITHCNIVVRPSTKVSTDPLPNFIVDVAPRTSHIASSLSKPSETMFRRSANVVPLPCGPITLIHVCFELADVGAFCNAKSFQCSL